jgi:hypothetical protein
VNPAHLTELSVTGLVLLLFGIGWVAFGSIQPIPIRPVCTNSHTFATSDIPLCSDPGPVAVMFYTLGAVAIIIGSVLLVLRTYVGIRQDVRTITSLTGAQS